jgi:hypothetical protein
MTLVTTSRAARLAARVLILSLAAAPLRAQSPRID